MENITISLYADNTPGVLQRVTAVFTRRKLNIESLTVSETERDDISRFTIVIHAERDVAQKVTKQLCRIVEVEHAAIALDAELLSREVALMRVHCEDDKSKRQIEEICKSFSGKVEKQNEHALIIEKTGTEAEIRCLLEMLKPFGILEFVRSGRIAMTIHKEEGENRDFSIEQEASVVLQ
jgi:acetolactate synthase-1/3 small subunit